MSTARRPYGGTAFVLKAGQPPRCPTCGAWGRFDRGLTTDGFGEVNIFWCASPHPLKGR